MQHAGRKLPKAIKFTPRQDSDRVSSRKGTLQTIDQTYAWLSGMLPENRPGSDNYAIFIKDANSDESTVIGVVVVHRIDGNPRDWVLVSPFGLGQRVRDRSRGGIHPALLAS